MSFNMALESIFRAFTKASGVTAAHCDASFWVGAIQGNEIAELNDVGHDECRVLAARALEEFEHAHARAPAAKNKKLVPSKLPELDKEDLGDDDEDDDDEDDEDDDEEDEEPEASRPGPSLKEFTAARRLAAKGRSPAVNALVARCEQALADPRSDAATRKVAQESLRQVDAVPKFVIETITEAVAPVTSFRCVNGKMVKV